MSQPLSPQSPGEAAPSVAVLTPTVLTGEEWDVLGGEDLRTKVPVLQRLGLMASRFSGLLPEQEADAAQSVLGDSAPRHIALAAVQNQDGEQGHWVVVGGPNTGERVAERSFDNYGLGDPNEELKARREAEAAKKAQEELSFRKQTVTSILQEATHRSELAGRLPEERSKLDFDTGAMAMDIVGRIGDKPEGGALALAVAGNMQDPGRYRNLVIDIIDRARITDPEKRQTLFAVADHFAYAKQQRASLETAIGDASHRADRAYQEGDVQFAAQMLAMAFSNSASGNGRLGLGGKLTSLIGEQIDASVSKPAT